MITMQIKTSYDRERMLKWCETNVTDFALDRSQMWGSILYCSFKNEDDQDRFKYKFVEFIYKG